MYFVYPHLYNKESSPSFDQASLSTTCKIFIPGILTAYPSGRKVFFLALQNLTIKYFIILSAYHRGWTVFWLTSFNLTMYDFQPN